MNDTLEKMNIAPDFNKLLGKLNNGFVNRRKQQISGFKILQEIRKQVHSQINSIDIADKRVRLLSEFNEERSISSYG